MTERRITRRYVQGFLEVAREQNCVEEAEQALRRVDDLLNREPDIIRILHHPTVSRERKKSLLREFLGDGAPEALKRFTDYVIDKKRERILPFIYEQYREAADTLRGLVRARVCSAADLTGAQVERLSGELEKRLDKRVELDCAVDKALLGGMQVFIGTYVIDGSVTGRLNRLHKHLLEEVGQLKTVA